MAQRLICLPIDGESDSGWCQAGALRIPQDLFRLTEALTKTCKAYNTIIL